MEIEDLKLEKQQLLEDLDAVNKAHEELKTSYEQLRNMHNQIIDEYNKVCEQRDTLIEVISKLIIGGN